MSSFHETKRDFVQ